MYRTLFRVVASNLEALPQDLGLPNIYAPYIERWHSTAGGWIVEAILEERSGTNWRELGNYLTRRLLSAEKFAGMSVDGSFPILRLSAWMKAESEGGGRANISVTYTGRPGRHSNVTWNSLHEVGVNSWLSRLWTPLRSDLFHVACDLVLAVFADDLITPLGWDQPIRVRDFGALLGHALGWIVPLDGDLGFILGITKRIDLGIPVPTETTTVMLGERDE